MLYVLLEEWSSIEVVDRNIEEALILGVVQVHGNHMVGTGTCQKICYECACLRDPLSVSRTRLESLLLMRRLLLGWAWLFMILNAIGHGSRRLPALASIMLAKIVQVLSVIAFLALRELLIGASFVKSHRGPIDCVVKLYFGE